MKKRRVVVNDRMQQNYIYWPAEPVGKNFHPEFKPQLTPKQMLALGVFGGQYMTDCRREFPRRGSPGRSYVMSDTIRF